MNIISKPYLQDISLANAINQRNVAEVEKILKKERQPNRFDRLGNSYLARLAARVEETANKILFLFVYAGANPNIPSKSGLYPLHEAASAGNIVGVNLLYKARATIDCREGDGVTPLLFAAMNERWDVYTVLLQYGADAGCCTNEGWTPELIKMHYHHVRHPTFAEEEFLWRKFLGHLFFLRGEYPLLNRQVSLEGSYQPIMTKMLLDLIGEYSWGSAFHPFIERFIHSYRYPPRGIEHFQEMLAKHDPVIIPSGWCGHALNLLFYENYLVICNGGQGVQRGVTLQCYKVKSSFLNEQQLQWVYEGFPSPKMGACFLYWALPRFLEAEVDGKCLQLQNLSMPLLSTVGNCTLHSGFLSFYASLYLAIGPHAIDAYEDWMTFTMINEFNRYLKWRKIVVRNRDVVSDDLLAPERFVEDCQQKIQERIQRFPACNDLEDMSSPNEV